MVYINFKLNLIIIIIYLEQCFLCSMCINIHIIHNIPGTPTKIYLPIEKLKNRNTLRRKEMNENPRYASYGITYFKNYEYKVPSTCTGTLTKRTHTHTTHLLLSLSHLSHPSLTPPPLSLTNHIVDQ